MIRWAFLDVGNVLLDEDPLTFRVFSVHVDAVRAARPDLSFGQLLADREERARAGSRWPLFEVVHPYLEDEGCRATWEAADREVRARFDELSPPIVGADAMLGELAARFRLGLIANQGPECRRRLDRLGWLDRFEVVALSEEEGVYKPDPALFRLALQRSGADPREAVMIGDRLDNDVGPAAGLGMATVRVGWPRRAAKGWSPTDADGSAYLGMLERLADRRGGVVPSRSVDDQGGVVAAVLGLDLNRPG